jgi:LPS-assembly lipoprotein
MKTLTLIACLAAMGGATLLGGCGFTPLYAQPGMSAHLASVQVITPDGRTGHLLSEDLQDALAVRRGEAPAYRLDLAVDEKRYSRGLTVTQTATWYELNIKVSYSLIDNATGKTVKSGLVPVSVSYNAVNDPYAGVVAQQDGQKRAASEAATRIRLQLSAYFANTPQTVGRIP